MIRAASGFTDYQMVLAGAPGIDPFYYDDFIRDTPVKVVYRQTYPLLANAHAAMVTSGTATLETALFRVPQVVCYHTPIGKVISFLRRHIIKVKYISLVNLIAGREVVRELVADTMTVDNMKHELALLLDKDERQKMLSEYDRIIQMLGEPGASEKAARLMLDRLESNTR